MLRPKWFCFKIPKETASEKNQFVYPTSEHLAQFHHVSRKVSPPGHLYSRPETWGLETWEKSAKIERHPMIPKISGSHGGPSFRLTWNIDRNCIEVLWVWMILNDTLAPSPQVILVESMSWPRLKSKSPTTNSWSLPPQTLKPQPQQLAAQMPDWRLLP